MTKVSIENATYPQLMKFAEQAGLDVKYAHTKKEEVLALIEIAMPGTTDIVVEAEAPVPIAKASSGKGTHYNDDPKVMINIASDTMNGGSRHYPIAVNGELILVHRDKDVEIPYRHFLALQNAIETVFRQETNPLTGLPFTVSSDQSAVRYSVKRGPSQDEIDDFHKRTRDVGRELVKQAA